MDRLDAELVMLARLAGLEATLEKYPEDIQFAVSDARSFMKALASDLGPADEPWPPMRVDGRL